MKYPFSDIYGEKTRFGSRTPMTDPSQMARDWMGQAAGTYGRMQAGQKTKTEGPGHTAGGAIMGGLGGAATGAMVGSAVPGIGTGIGAGVGFVVGLGTYLFS